jgi:peptide/nickel transport system substrate-binding protein
MKTKKKALAAIAVAASVTLVLSACGGSSSDGNKPKTASGGYNAAASAVVNPSTKTGGTLKLAATSDCDAWDPQRTYYGWCWNMQRLFTRSLVGYAKVNGAKFELAPDLATSLGEHNADFTKWTYKLKPGLKFSNGAPITPKDVKYGIERLFATDVINGGPGSYFTTTIDHPADYKGPYKSGDLDTIETTDDSITFNLSSAYSDWPYLMAMAASAPVPYKTEGGKGFVGATYTKHPISSGPYMIKSYTPNKSVIFTKNPNWDASTDTIHKPLADEIDLEINTNSADIDSKLEAGTYDAKADVPVEAALQAKIFTNPDLKKNADDPVTAFTRFFTVYQSVIPNKDCRLAIFYATNKAAILQAYGGAAAGTVAGSMTPPGIAGYNAKTNPYPSGKDNTGDLVKAKAALEKCGKPNGFSTKMAYSTASDASKKAFEAEQSALKRVGIKITGAPNDGSTYYSTFVGSPSNVKNQGFGISIYGWGADFPTGYGFFQSIAASNSILPTGNSNQPSLRDATVDGVLKDSLLGKSTPADWEKLDAAVMDNAVYLPIFFGRNLYYRNPRLTNITSDNALAFGIYDFVNVGVTK